MPSPDFLWGAAIGASAALFSTTFFYLHLMTEVLKHDSKLLSDAADALARRDAADVAEALSERPEAPT